MTFMKLKNEEEIAIWDRAYRLRKNRNQVLSDQAYFAGGTVGLLVSLALKSNPAFGSLVGSTGSLVLMGLHNNMGAHS